ncbi:hypothetical protein PG985_009665 [Apiospora marii]|uniref:uncharacterized protein n=1 Tax=Apiospora marii TaxID=335849 RepID=UPI00312E95BC
MQLHPFLAAGLGAAVVAAAPSPLIISSPVLSPQQLSCDDIPALPVLQALGDAAAASICSRLAPVPTQTAQSTTTRTETATATVTETVTETDAQTASVTASTVVQTTETAIVDGPTDISTETITTVTTVGRTGPYKKKHKRGDKCAAKPKSSSSSSSATTTTSSAPTSSASSDPVDALESFPDDVVAAACACLNLAAPTTTETVTVTATVPASASATQSTSVTVSPTLATAFQTVTAGTETATTTTTAPGLTTVVTTATTATTTATVVTATVTTADPTAPATTSTVTSNWQYVQAFDNRCAPTKWGFSGDNYGGSPPTYGGAFQSCVDQCAGDYRCGQIYFTYDDPVREYGGVCYTGGHPEIAPSGTNSVNDRITWRSGADFQCGIPYESVHGVWYNKPM